MGSVNSQQSSDRLVVEVQTRDGRTVSRTRFSQLPIRVGRDPFADVFVDDPYVDANHLEIDLREEDGLLVVRDLESKNGTRFLGREVRGVSADVSSDTPITIGETTLRFALPGTFVAEAESLTPKEPESPDLLSKIPAWAALFGAVALGIVVERLGAYESAEPTEIVGSLFTYAILIAIWAGVWSIGTRLFSKAFRFKRHLTWACVVGSIVFLLGAVSGIATFVFQLPVTGAVSSAFSIGLVWVYLYGHVSIASRKPKAFRVLVTSAVVGGISGLLWMDYLTDEDPTLPLSASIQMIQPVPPGLTRSDSHEDFMVDLEALEEQLVEEVRQENEERDSNP